MFLVPRFRTALDFFNRAVALCGSSDALRLSWGQADVILSPPARPPVAQAVEDEFFRRAR
jgi:hypothetical protein